MTATYATLIAALIAAIAAIVSPLITTIITTRNSYKLKTIELLFSAKLDAYKQFANIAFSTRSEFLPKDREELHKAWSYASLFSSADTRPKLNKYYASVLNGYKTEADLNELSNSISELIDAMQLDLCDFEQYYKK